MVDISESIPAEGTAGAGERFGRLMRLVLILERVLYRLVIVPLVAFLPAPLAYAVACLRGDFRYHLDAPKREEIIRCLESVFGDQLSLAKRGRVARDFFRLRSCLSVDQMRIAGKGRALARLVEIQGLEHIEAALAAGKGAILCTAHFGSYNCGISLLGTRGFPITVVGRWASNAIEGRQSSLSRTFYRLTVQKSLARHRHRANIEPSGQMKVAAQAAALLRQNELITIGIDSPLLDGDRQRAIPMDFLHGHALLLPGAATIAQLLGAPVLMLTIRRSADWRHQVLEISPPVSLDGDAVTVFQRCLAVAEAAIRQDPAHWAFWNFRDLVALGLVPEDAKQRKKH